MKPSTSAVAKFLFSCFTVALFFFVILNPRPAFGNTITVTSIADSGAGSLRAAIASASPGDTINFAVTGTIILTTGQLAINENLRINGPGTAQLTIGGNINALLSVGPGITVAISGLTTSGGNPNNAGEDIYNAGTLLLSNMNITGGSHGIYNDTGSTLIVNNSTISGNNAYNGSVNYGGGIFNNSGAVATLTNTTVAGNKANVGEGIFNNGILTITDSTVSGNESVYGGLPADSAIFNAGGSLSLNNTTVANNGRFGIFNGLPNYGGYYFPGGSIVISNSTIYGNGGGINNSSSASTTLKGTILAGDGGQNCYLNGGSFVSDGYNLSDDSSCALTGLDDLNNNPAGLDPNGLQNNGGPTQTVGLLPTSAAVDVIPLNPTNYCTDANGASVSTDQRGVTRPQGAACDIGAFELAIDNDSQYSQLSGGNTFNGSQTVNGNVSATNFVGNGSGLTGVNASFLGGIPGSNYARLDIGNAFNGSQTVNGNVTATSFFGDGSNLTGITATDANFANSANVALTAGNSALLGGVAATDYARLDVGNTFTGNQTITGNVGLGVTSPIQTLSVYSAANNSLGGVRISGVAPGLFFNQGSESLDFTTQRAGLGLATGNGQFGNLALPNDINLFTEGGNINFNTTSSFAPSEPNVRMTVTAAGNVGIATQTPAATLEVNGSSQFDGPVTFAPGQTFPGTGTGTISGVTAGAGLTGGGTTGNIPLGVNESVVAFQSDLANGVNTAEVFATSEANSALTTSETFANSKFLPLTGGTLTGNLAGTGATFSGTASAGQLNAANGYLLDGAPVLNASVTSEVPPSGDFGGSVSLGFGAGPAISLWNTYVGLDAGENQPANNSVSNNTFVGKTAGAGSTAGFNNSFFGAEAGIGTTGNGNTFVGIAAGSGVSTGSNNTMIGGFTGGITGGLTGSNNIYIGPSINPPLTESNAIRIGVNGTQNATYVAGVYGSTTSSGTPVLVDSTGHLGTGGGGVIGSITGISAGAGLTGGGTSGNVSLSIPNGAVTNAMLANPSLTVAAGSGVTVTGASPIALGGTTTVSLATNTCAVGSAVTAHPFTCTAFPAFGANTFTGTQTMPAVAVSGNATVSGPVVAGGSSSFGSTSASAIGVTGVGVSVGVSGTGATGVLGSGNVGISGSGTQYGIAGSSSNGDGVFGSTSSGYGVVGADGFTGSGGNAPASAGVIGLGTTTGVVGVSASTSASNAAGVFVNINPFNTGNLLLGVYNGTNEFTVDAKGDVTANGNVAAAGSVIIGSGGTPIAEYIATTLITALPAITSQSCTTFTTAALTGFTTGNHDTIALGIPNALASAYALMFQAWETSASTSPTITIRVCNFTGARYAGSGSTSYTIGIDVIKH